MKREIKFEYGFKSVNGIIKKVYSLAEIPNIKEKCDVWNVLPIVYVRKYSGLKDKNGKEIYEGDIVNFRANYTNKPCGYMNGIVKITEYELLLIVGDLEYNALEETDEFPYSKCEIIGNIYENPELLK